MTSTKHGDKRKDGQGEDDQGSPKRHRATPTFNFWSFFNSVKAAVERHDYDRVKEIMAQDEARRIHASAKELKYYAQHSAVTIKEFLEKIVQKDVIIDQLSDSVDESYLMDLNADNERLKADARRLQASLVDLSQYCADIEARNNQLQADLDDAKLARAGLQLCTGKLVTEAADLKARHANQEKSIQVIGQFADKAVAEAEALRQQWEKQAHELKRGRDIVRHLETEVHHQREREARLQQEVARQDQELKASKGVAKAGQQEVERLRKEFSFREQELKAKASAGDQLRQDLGKANRECKAHKEQAERVGVALGESQQEVAKQAQALKAAEQEQVQSFVREQMLAGELLTSRQELERFNQVVNIAERQKLYHKQGQELEDCKDQIQQLQAKLAVEHKSLMEAGKELALLETKYDQLKAAAAAAAPAPAAAPAFKVWTTCKEGDWAVVCPALHERIKTGEIFWICQIKEFGFKTDPDTGIREERLQVRWYEWESKTAVFAERKLGLVQRDSVLFYTDKLPANPAEKQAIADYIKQHFTSSSTTAALPRRVAAPDEMDG